MAHHHTLLGQMLQLFPRFEFQKAVSETGTEYHARDFSSWNHFAAMLFGQLAGQDSLRGIEAGLASQSKGLYRLGVGPVHRSTLDYDQEGHRGVKVAMFKEELCSKAKEGISRFRKHLEDFEHLLDVGKNRINENASRISLEGYDDDEQHEICSDFAEQEFYIDDYIAVFHYRAIFLLIYAWFEHLLLFSYCDPKKYNSLEEDSFFKKLKAALKQNGKDGVIPGWQLITNFAFIRNLITHNDASLKKDTEKKKEMERFVRDNPDKIKFCGAAYYFGEEDDNYPRDIKINKHFCIYVLSTFETFLNDILI